MIGIDVERRSASTCRLRSPTVTLARLTDAPDRANLTMTMPLAIMNGVVKQDLSWDEAFIGYWCEFERHPNVYHAGFWRLFQAPYYQKRIPAGVAVPGAAVSRQSTVAELLETYGERCGPRASPLRFVLPRLSALDGRIARARGATARRREPASRLARQRTESRHRRSGDWRQLIAFTAATPIA